MNGVSVAELVGYLDQYLRIREIPDEPNAINGLQVENASGRVDRIVAAVDASLETIQGAGAGRKGSALLLVHHGMFWDGSIPVTGRRYRRVRSLMDSDTALYAAHIPLDVHAEVGNNAVLARDLGLTDPQPFDLYKGVAIGVQGILGNPVPRERLVVTLEQMLSTRARLIPGGPEQSRRIGIITGAAGGRIAAARDAGLDTYITGEGAHHTYFDAMELGVNVIYAGHYATETVGIKALAQHLGTRFNLPGEFHHHPTGL
jgi:dinuclear metal center YbgI/SA1388 family protein